MDVATWGARQSFKGWGRYVSVASFSYFHDIFKSYNYQNMPPGGVAATYTFLYTWRRGAPDAPLRVWVNALVRFRFLFLPSWHFLVLRPSKHAFRGGRCDEWSSVHMTTWGLRLPFEGRCWLVGAVYFSYFHDILKVLQSSGHTPWGGRCSV